MGNANSKCKQSKDKVEPVHKTFMMMIISLSVVHNDTGEDTLILAPFGVHLYLLPNLYFDLVNDGV